MRIHSLIWEQDPPQLSELIGRDTKKLSHEKWRAVEPTYRLEETKKLRRPVSTNIFDQGGVGRSSIKDLIKIIYKYIDQRSQTDAAPN